MTLERVLEPEVMDSADEARDYDQMDHAAVNRVFVEDLLKTGPVCGDVLDLGCGTAQLPVQLCETAPDCRVMAVDLSAHMLELARFNVEVAGLSDRIHLEQMDAKEMLWEDAHFDLVISNSIVHHIAEPLTVLREAVRVVRPGGRLFFRDLLRPADEAEVAALVETHMADESAHGREMFEASLRAALNLDEIRALVGRLGFPEASVQQTTDRHWTWSAQTLES